MRFRGPKIRSRSTEYLEKGGSNSCCKGKETQFSWRQHSNFFLLTNSISGERQPALTFDVDRERNGCLPSAACFG